MSLRAQLERAMEVVPVLLRELPGTEPFGELVDLLERHRRMALARTLELLLALDHFQRHINDLCLTGLAGTYDLSEQARNALLETAASALSIVGVRTLH